MITLSKPSTRCRTPRAWQSTTQYMGRNWNTHSSKQLLSQGFYGCVSVPVFLFRAVKIDFHRLRVRGKSLSVRRLDDGKTVWLWYCTLRHKWSKYGDKVNETRQSSLSFYLYLYLVSSFGQFRNQCWYFLKQDSKGNCSTVKSSDIERKFKSNPRGSFTFTVGSETLEIKFPGNGYPENRHRVVVWNSSLTVCSQTPAFFSFLPLEMQQVGRKRKRRVARRPFYRPNPTGSGWVCIFSGIMLQPASVRTCKIANKQQAGVPTHSRKSWIQWNHWCCHCTGAITSVKRHYWRPILNSSRYPWAPQLESDDVFMGTPHHDSYHPAVFVCTWGISKLISFDLHCHTITDLCNPYKTKMSHSSHDYGKTSQISIL